LEAGLTQRSVAIAVAEASPPSGTLPGEATTTSAAGATKSREEELPSRDAEDSVVAADVAARSTNGTESESINVWPDEAAESAFIAEARERGETAGPAKPSRRTASDSEREGESDSKSLPALDTLVQRIPPAVRETLDELFRAKFTTVRRVPAKVLKS
jgi:hypothetical protein